MTCNIFYISDEWLCNCLYPYLYKLLDQYLPVIILLYSGGGLVFFIFYFLDTW